MNEALYELFCAIVKQGLIQYMEENRKGEPAWVNLLSYMNESEAIRFDKEYEMICRFVDKKEFMNTHKTYSLSVRNKNMDVFFNVLYEFSRTPWRIDRPFQLFIFRVFISKLWKLRMRLALKVRKT